MTATVTRINRGMGHIAEVDPDTVATSMQIVHAAKITYRNLDYWTCVELLRCLNPDIGSGRGRYYPIAELHVATLGKRLIDAGFTTTAALNLARKFIEQDTNSLDIGGIIITRWAE